MRRSLGAALLAGPLATAAGMALGKARGWGWILTFKCIEQALFLAGSLLLLGALAGFKPRADPELRPATPRPEGLSPEPPLASTSPEPLGTPASEPPGAPASGAPPAAPPDELDAGERARLASFRDRAPALLAAGLVCMLWTHVLFEARFVLGEVYGDPVPRQAATTAPR